MKKYSIVFLLIIISIAFPFPSKAQILNAGFEQWTAGQPDNWWTNNVPTVLSPVTQTTTKHSGSYALRGEVLNYAGYPYTALVSSGSLNDGFSISQRYARLTGYYQFNPVGGDQLEIYVIMTKGGIGIAEGELIIKNAAASYTQFTVDLTYYSSEVPDLCDITIVINGPTEDDDYHAGSVMYLDDLAFSGTTAVDENSAQMQIPERFALGQSYPNPFNPSCMIEYSVPEISKVSVKVYDIMGREITTLFQGINVPGSHKVVFQPDQLPAGLYFYQMTATALKSGKTFSEVKKTMYVK